MQILSRKRQLESAAPKKFPPDRQEYLARCKRLGFDPGAAAKAYQYFERGVNRG